ncbi:MAG: DNRLRE domain-containing protein [Veillonellales bacterium]
MGVIFFKPPVMDTSVSLGSRHRLHCRDNELNVGRKDDNTFRALLQFDLSQLPFSLPIFRATLYLFLFSDYCDKPQTIQLFQVLSRWNTKTVSGNNFPLTGAAPVDTVLKTNHNKDCLAFNITPLAAKWQNNLAANLGVMIRTKCEIGFNNLIRFCSSEFKDSSCWPYIEINYLEPQPPDDHGYPHLEFRSNVHTSDEINYTNPINTLCFNYSYLVMNSGESPAIAYLQISPDGEQWLTQTETARIQPKQLHTFTAIYIAKFSRLCYTSAAPGQSTALTVYVQGTS